MLIPLVGDICVAVDIVARRVTVDPPDGLIELNRPCRTVAVKIDIVTIFPEMVQASLAEGDRRAGNRRRGARRPVHDLRDHTTDRHRVVDDVPFGGGPGMVLKPEPLFRAVDDDSGRRGARPAR